jgi:hypothetical protein
MEEKKNETDGCAIAFGILMALLFGGIAIAVLLAPVALLLKWMFS